MYDAGAMSLMSRRAILQALIVNALATRLATAQTRVVSKAKPLAKDAVTHDWTAFLGPTHNAISTETKLSRRLPPPLVWELTKGTGYTSPAIAGQRLVFLHRLGNEEIVECLHAETGATDWQFRYPTSFEDRYGYNNGPRSSPVIDAGSVYTVGAQAQLHCLDLGTGKLIWKRDLEREYRVRQDFFGAASTPLIEGQLLDRECRRARRPVRRRPRQDHRTGSLAGRQGLGAELRIAGAGGDPRKAARARVCRRRVGSPVRRTAVDRSVERPDRFRLSVAEPHLRVRQRLLSRRLRQQGVRLGQLSSGRARWSRSGPTSRTGGCGRRRSSGCISTRRSTRTAISTGLTGATSPMRRSPASTRRPARSCGARRQSGRSRSRPEAGVSSNRSEPIEDRCWR